MIFCSCVKSRSWLLANRLLRIMKLAVFLTLITVLQASADSFGQVITLNVRNLPLPEAMERIQQQSGYLFFLKGEALANMRVSANIRQATLRQAMTSLTRDLGLDWVIRDKTIILRRSNRDKEPAFNPADPFQERIVTGRVTDDAGAPLEGATVTVK